MVGFPIFATGQHQKAQGTLYGTSTAEPAGPATLKRAQPAIRGFSGHGVGVQR